MNCVEAEHEEPGTLMIIGGSEDRTDQKAILQSFVDQSGGTDAALVVLTAASEIPDEVWGMYRNAFGALGAAKLTHVRISRREDAAAPAIVQQVAQAGGVFMTGGSQERLVELIGGTPLHEALRAAYLERRACLAGTSAGASGLCTHMIVEGEAEHPPEKDTARLGAGLGFLTSSSP